jgi:hypothetical protein
MTLRTGPGSTNEINDQPIPRDARADAHRPRREAQHELRDQKVIAHMPQSGEPIPG